MSGHCHNCAFWEAARTRTRDAFIRDSEGEIETENGERFTNLGGKPIERRDQRGSCRAMAPSVTNDEQGRMWRSWPSTSPDDWCGMWNGAEA